MLVDAHAHLDRYEEDLEYALTEITQDRIFTISNSMDLRSYQRNLEIADRCDLVVPTFGVHPWNASQYVNNLEDLSNAIDQSPIIGEIGLDYYFVKDTSQYPAQEKVFDFFLTAASRQGKIVNLHTKGAEREVLHLLGHHKIGRAIIHWYSGPWHILRTMVDHGFYFTVGVEVLNSQHIQDIAKYLPAELILTETDNPGGPESLTGEAGTPSLIKDITKKLAEIRRTSVEVIIDTVRGNLARLGNNDPWLCALE